PFSTRTSSPVTCSATAIFTYAYLLTWRLKFVCRAPAPPLAHPLAHDRDTVGGVELGSASQDPRDPVRRFESSRSRRSAVLRLQPMPRTARTPFALGKPDARRLWLRAQKLDERAPFGAGPEATRAAVEHRG